MSSVASLDIYLCEDDGDIKQRQIYLHIQSYKFTCPYDTDTCNY